DDAKRRGPKELRAHGRAVAVADYEILALRTPGAQVARAHAVSGFHPAFPGAPIPGVVCVFVVPVSQSVGPPIADQDTLRSVTQNLTSGSTGSGKPTGAGSSPLAPGGVEVVAAAPFFHRVRIIATVVVRPTASRSEALRDVLALFKKY